MNLAIGQLHVKVVRPPLTRYQPEYARFNRTKNTDLVRTNGGRVRRCQEVITDVHDRDVRPLTEPSFEQKVCPACIRHFNAVDLDTDMPRSLKHVDSLRKELGQTAKSEESRAGGIPCTGPSDECRFSRPLRTMHPQTQTRA